VSKHFHHARRHSTEFDTFAGPGPDHRRPRRGRIYYRGGAPLECTPPPFIINSGKASNFGLNFDTIRKETVEFLRDQLAGSRIAGHLRHRSSSEAGIDHYRTAAWPCNKHTGTELFLDASGRTERQHSQRGPGGSAADQQGAEGYPAENGDRYSTVEHQWATSITHDLTRAGELTSARWAFAST
jgi:hypothetical protein